MNIITFTVSLSEQKFWKKVVAAPESNNLISDELKFTIKHVLFDYKFKPEDMVTPSYESVNKLDQYIPNRDDRILVFMNIIFNETEEDKDLLTNLVQKANEIGITASELCSRALKYFYLMYKTSQHLLKEPATSKEKDFSDLRVITWHAFRYSEKDNIPDLVQPIVLKTDDEITFNDFNSKIKSTWTKIANALIKKMGSDKHYRNIFHDFYDFNKNRDKSDAMSGIEFVIKTDGASPIDIYRRMSCERNWDVVKTSGKLQYWIVKVFFYKNKFYGHLDFSCFTNPIERISNPQVVKK